MVKNQREAFVAAKDILLNGGFDKRVKPELVKRTPNYSHPFIKAGTELDKDCFLDRPKDADPNGPDAAFPKAADLWEAWKNSSRVEGVVITLQEKVDRTVKKSRKPKSLIGKDDGGGDDGGIDD